MKTVQLNVRLTPLQKRALEARADRSGASVSEIMQREALFSRIDDALGFPKGAIVRFIYEAITARWESIRAIEDIRGLTKAEQAEIGPLSEWLGFLFGPLDDYDPDPEQFAAACERLLRYVPATVAESVSRISEMITTYSADEFRADFYGYNLPSEQPPDDEWTAGIGA